jgi:RHS repeat-associated protein
MTSHNAAAIYAYDNLNRLTMEAFTSGALGNSTRTWSYDAAGNRLDAGATFGADHRLLTGFSYDAKGNAKSKGASALTFDSVNRLSSAATAMGTATYAYDFAGRRVGKSLGGVSRAWVYDGEHALTEYLNGSVAARYTYGPNTDEILIQHRNGQAYFYHTDAVGSVVLITAADGTVVQRYAYDAWGELKQNIGGFSFSGTAPVNTFTFHSRERDEELGMYHFRARQYDPSVGRFLQKDPQYGSLDESGALHPYAFALNDPVNRRDPSGEAVLVGYIAISTGSAQEIPGAVIGYLHAFSAGNLIFLGEYMGALDLGLDITSQWDYAIDRTAEQLEKLDDIVEDIAKVTPNRFVNAYANGASFKIGGRVKAQFEALTVNAKFKIKITVGGFEEGVEAAMTYLRGLRP